MNNNKVQAIVEKVKELVQRGNVSRIVVRKGERVLLNIPVNVGIVGGVVAVASAKWVLLASILATVGFGCSVEVVKEDGNIVNVMSEEDTRRVRTAAQSAVSSVKDAVHFEKVVDQTTEATWTVPEEKTSEEPEVHTEEEHREEKFRHTRKSTCIGKLNEATRRRLDETSPKIKQKASLTNSVLLFSSLHFPENYGITVPLELVSSNSSGTVILKGYSHVQHTQQTTGKTFADLSPF